MISTSLTMLTLFNTEGVPIISEATQLYLLALTNYINLRPIQANTSAL